MPTEALSLAGKVYRACRRRGGARPGVLPDFCIGLHAAHAGMPLVTRDPGRYRFVFPTMTVIAPPSP